MVDVCLITQSATLPIVLPSRQLAEPPSSTVLRRGPFCSFFVAYFNMRKEHDIILRQSDSRSRPSICSFFSGSGGHPF